MSDTPQYAYGTAKESHQPYVPSTVPPSEFQVRLTARCDEWRVRFPERAAQLRAYVALTLGYTPRRQISDAILAEMCKPGEERLIAIMSGWPETEEAYMAKQGER